MPESKENPRLVAIGSALTRLRDRKRLTSEDVATAMGKQPSSRTMVQRWERGEASPSITNVDLYLRAVDATFSDLERELSGASSDDQGELVEILRRAAELAAR